MSGFKRALVTISEEEYQRMHAAEMERLYKKSKHPANRPQHSNSDIAIQKHINEMRNRQTEFEKLIEDLGNEIGNHEIETERALVCEKTEFYQELSIKVADIWENSSRMEEVFNKFQDQYHLDSQRRNFHIQNTNNQINKLLKIQKQKDELVLSCLASASGLGEFIANQYDHERFAPGRVDKIYQELAMAQNNLSRGMPEAALPVAQQAYLHFSELRLMLEQQTFEWQALFQVTWQAAQNLIEHFRMNAKCPALDMDGNELPVDLYLNFWSNGQFNDLGQRLKELINQLKAENSRITCQELENILQKELPEFQKQFDSIVYQSRFAAINSQLRINIADIALQALRSQGFNEEEYGYVSDDMRSPYFLSMKNNEGSQVTIWVNPVDNGENKNDLVVESHDFGEKTERELRKRSNEIITSLRQKGLQVGNLESGNHEQNKRFRVPGSQHAPGSQALGNDDISTALH